MSPPNRPFATQIVPYGKAAIEQAARLIGEGLPVAVPTETVYGLAADATQGDAVARIYAAKGRPDFNPLIVHVEDMAQAERLGARPCEAARDIAERYWPGALTFVVPAHLFHGFAPAVLAGLRTVALRSPSHPAIRELLRAVGRPLAAPSANASGSISPTRAEHVLRSLNGRIPLIIDAGPTSAGLESTIVRIVGNELKTLRPGPVDADAVAMYAKLKFATDRAGGIEAPGQLASHYAPGKPLRLEAEVAFDGEWLIGFGAIVGDDSLSLSGDLREAAANFFSALHRADTKPQPRIAVAPVPDAGLGAAINDRLRRAAAPR